MSVQQQAKALGDPTRHRIFLYLAKSERTVGVAELTSHLELNHNAIRQHLAKLIEAGLVKQESNATGSPGRPRLLFRIDPAADERWGLAGPYQRLSLLLVDMIGSGTTAEETGRRAGRKLPVRPPNSDGDRVPALQEAIARGGFEPKMRDRGDSVEYILRNCPFTEAAAADPDTVCGLHIGLARGLADQLEGVDVDDLIRNSPHRGGCQLRFHLSPVKGEETP